MIELITQILELDEFEGVSENIDIAKGKYELPLTFKHAWYKKKRFKQW